MLNIRDILNKKRAVQDAKKPVITDEQRRQLEQLTLYNGKNGWARVLESNEEDRPWTVVGILSCIQKDYLLNEMNICAEIRHLRYGGR